MYGSPLVGLQNEELMRIWCFLLTGPFSALAAAILTRWCPKAGAAWFLVGGICSAGLAVTFLNTDAGMLPLLVSVPMLAVGAWLFLAVSRGSR
jgi:hypothetical protein